MPKLISIQTTARILGMSERRAYQLANEGGLPGARRLGKRTVRVSVPELEAFIGAPLSPADVAEAA